MGAVTYSAKPLTVSRSAARPAPRATGAGATRGFFSRVLDSLIAARSAQAEREVARYLATQPQHDARR